MELRPGRRFALLLVLVALGFVQFSYVFVWRPQSQPPVKSDLVVAIAGTNEIGRLREAVKLVREGYATSIYTDIPRKIGWTCGERFPDVTMHCFVPSPDTTQGEARATAELAKFGRVTSVILVVDRYQATRAKLRFQRCFHGRLTVVTVPTTDHLVYNTLYQDAATIKAELWQRSC